MMDSTWRGAVAGCFSLRISRTVLLPTFSSECSTQPDCPSVRTFVRFLEEQHLVDDGNLEGMAFIRARVPKTLKVFSQLRNKLPTGIPTGHLEGIWTIVYCLVVGVCDGSYCDFTSK